MTKSIRTITMLLMLTSLLLPILACKHPLHKVMRSYEFTAISPPQTGWEVGSIVEIDKRYDTAPTLRATAESADAELDVYPSTAPDVSRGHDSKIDLNLGVSIEGTIKAKLAHEGAREYSVVAKGNEIRRVLIDEYILNTFPQIASRYSRVWAVALTENLLYYIYEIWCSTGLEYKFYGKNGAKLELEPVVDIPASLAADYTWSDQETLSYTGSERICLGYKVRPIVQAPTGEPVPQAAGGASAAGPEAQTKLWK